MFNGDPRDRLHDDELWLEIGLLTDVIIAANGAHTQLRASEIDQLLGVGRPPTPDGPA